MARYIGTLRPKIIILTDRDTEDLKTLRKEMRAVDPLNWDDYIQSLPDLFEDRFIDRIDELEALNPKLKDMNDRLTRHYGRTVSRYIHDAAELGDDGYTADISLLLDTLPGMGNIVVCFQTVGTMPLP